VTKGLRRTKAEPRAWQRMLSGRRLDLLDPSPMDIEIQDIAHGLARVARWNGQTTGEHAFSVAQHSVVVEEIVAHIQPDIEPRWRLAALLHDASEYVIGDMISPFKAALGVDYRNFEDRLETAIPYPLRPARQDAAGDQDADQGSRPRLRLLRGDTAGRLQPRRGAGDFRRAARGLCAHHRSGAGAAGPGALCQPLRATVRSRGLPVRAQLRLPDGIGLGHAHRHRPVGGGGRGARRGSRSADRAASGRDDGGPALRSLRSRRPPHLRTGAASLRDGADRFRPGLCGTALHLRRSWPRRAGRRPGRRPCGSRAGRLGRLPGAGALGASGPRARGGVGGPGRGSSPTRTGAPAGLRR
jgi:hypothetical protein